MEVSYIEILGSLGASLTTFSFLPQTIKTVKTGDTRGISLGMYLAFTIGVFFWLIYGFLTKNYIIILSAIILIIKIKNTLNGSDK